VHDARLAANPPEEALARIPENGTTRRAAAIVRRQTNVTSGAYLTPASGLTLAREAGAVNGLTYRRRVCV